MCNDYSNKYDYSPRKHSVLGLDRYRGSPKNALPVLQLGESTFNCFLKAKKLQRLSNGG